MWLILKAKLVLTFKIAYVDVVVVVISWIFGFEIVNMSEWREEGKKGRKKRGISGGEVVIKKRGTLYERHMHWGQPYLVIIVTNMINSLTIFNIYNINYNISLSEDWLCPCPTKMLILKLNVFFFHL